MSEHLEHEVANQHEAIRELRDRVRTMETRKTEAGLIVPAPTLLGPGNAVVSRVEFNRMRDGLVSEIEELKALVGEVSAVAGEAVRILDRMAGMGD